MNTPGPSGGRPEPAGMDVGGTGSADMDNTPPWVKWVDDEGPNIGRVPPVPPAPVPLPEGSLTGREEASYWPKPPPTHPNWRPASLKGCYWDERGRGMFCPALDR